MMTRNVDGQIITLTPDEEAAVLAEWAANPPPPDTLTPTLAQKASYRADVRFTNMVSQLRTATPAQIANFVNSNSTADAGTKDLLVRLFLLVGTLI